MALAKHAGIEQRIWHYAFLIICTLIFLFLIFPILVIIPLAFNAEPYFTFTEKMLTLNPDGYSLRWFHDLLGDADWRRSIGNSFFIAICSATIATGLGTIAALGLHRKEMPAKGLIMALLISPMIVPLIISAAALFSFYARVQLTNTFFGVILSHVVLGIPFVIITVTASLSGFDQSLIRASQSMGANQTRTFFKIIMPLLLPGVISGALFAFITSLDEVVLVNFLASAEQRTMPVKMFSGLRENISPTILALAVILVAISVALLLVLEGIRRRNEKLRGMSPG
jgi:putative spermidine/putrescine transport system permease protein